MRQQQRLYYKGNRLQQLRAFCHAAALGSFRKAAQSLFLHQPTLSLQIQALEWDLGVRLFYRAPRGVTLTPMGKLLLDLAKPLVEGMDSLTELFDERRKQSAEETVQVVASPMSMQRVLPDIFMLYLREFPQVHLRVFGRRVGEIYEMVLREEVGLGFGPEYQVPNDLDFLGCVVYGTVVITSRQHPLAARRRLTAQEVAQQPLILFEPNTLQNRVVTEWVEAHHFKPRIAIETFGWEAMSRCVEQGLGVGIISEGWLDKDTKAKFHVVPFSEFLGTRTYGILTKKGRYLSVAARHLIGQIEQAFAKKEAPLQL